ncbi:MAG: hypothetical protein LBT59_07890 [Clostridiales bacterium]|jgi:hypothetical protein|nr:hypothetical protein [Clostridiales bacterium]
MNAKKPLDILDPVALHKAGIDALVNALGPLGMALFIKQLESKSVYFTSIRDALLDGITLEEVEELKSVH